MPTREANINAFDLKVLKWLLNLYVTGTYSIDVLTEDKKKLCITDNPDGVNISDEYIVKIWQKEEEITHALSTEKLNQLCAIFRKNYGWYDFYNALSQFRPSSIPNGKPLAELKPEQYALVIKEAKKLFEDNKTFEDFAKNVLDKKELTIRDEKTPNSSEKNATEIKAAGTVESLERVPKIENGSKVPLADKDSLETGLKDEDRREKDTSSEIDSKKQTETTGKVKPNYFRNTSSFIKRRKKILLPPVAIFFIAAIFFLFQNHIFPFRQNRHSKVGKTDSVANKQKNKELKPHSTLDSINNSNTGVTKEPEQKNFSNNLNNKSIIAYRNMLQIPVSLNPVDTHKFFPAQTSLKKVSTDSMLKAAKYVKRAEIRKNNNDFKNAVLYYDTGILLNPYSKETYIFRAQVKEQIKNYSGAIADMGMAIQLDAENAEYYSTRGKWKTNVRDFKGAITDFDKALKIDSNRASDYISRGQAKDSIRNYEGAEDDYTEAAKINPKIILQAYSCRARSKDKMKDYSGAIDDWNYLIKTDTNNPDPYEGRAGVEYKINKIQESMDDFEKSAILSNKYKLEYPQYENPPEKQKKKGFFIFKSKKEAPPPFMQKN